MVICLERGADLHTAQLMPLPLTVSCFSKIQIAFTFLVPAHPGSPGQRAVKLVCVCYIFTYSIYFTISGQCSVFSAMHTSLYPSQREVEVNVKVKVRVGIRIGVRLKSRHKLRPGHMALSLQ